MRLIVVFIIGGYMALNYSEVASFVMQASVYFKAMFQYVVNTLATL